MALKLYTMKVDGYEMETKYRAFTVTADDECTCKVSIEEGFVFTLDSWKEAAEAITQAIERLELE